MVESLKTGLSYFVVPSGEALRISPARSRNSGEKPFATRPRRDRKSFFAD